MALISSQSLKGGSNVASKKTAEKDIVVQNDAGQYVVVAHKGQEIPDGVDTKGAVSRDSAIANPEAGRNSGTTGGR